MRRTKNELTKTCQQCGTSFFNRALRQRFCSVKCAQHFRSDSRVIEHDPTPEEIAERCEEIQKRSDGPHDWIPPEGRRIVRLSDLEIPVDTDDERFDNRIEEFYGHSREPIRWPGPRSK